MACTWREVNELWETVWWDGSGVFTLLDRNGPHLPTYCVWEMGIVAHETRAWRRVLADDRGATGIEAYLDDAYAGEV